MPPQQIPPQQIPPQQMPPQQMPQQQSNNEGQMVDDILNELEITDDNAQQDIIETYNYAMDPSQIPPEKLEGNFLEAKENNYMEESPNMIQEKPKLDY